MTPRDKSFSQIENVNKSMKCKHVKRFHIHKSGRFLKTFASSVYFCLLELMLRRRLHHSICIPVHLKHIADLSNTNAVDCPHVDGLVQERRNSSAWVMELVFLALTFPSNCMEVCRVTAKTKLSLDWVGAFNQLRLYRFSLDEMPWKLNKIRCDCFRWYSQNRVSRIQSSIDEDPVFQGIG